MIMKALSFRQPWIHAILHMGKRVENRDWKPGNPNLRYRGDFLMHASGKMTRDEYENFCWTCGHVPGLATPEQIRAIPDFGDLPRGGIVGIATLVDIVRDHASGWFTGPFGLVLDNVRSLPFTPHTGQLGFFNVNVGGIAGLGANA